MLFPTTNWSQIIAFSRSGDREARESLDRICRAYWAPVHAIVRLRFSSEQDAQDVTQSFFLHVIERSAISRADQLKGRFRDYLRGMLNLFISSELRAARAQKRGGDAGHVEYDDERDSSDSPGDDGAESFDHEWAHTVMKAALASVRSGCNADETRWEVLKTFLPGGGGGMAYEDGAARCGMSLSAFKMAVSRLRNDLRAALRAEVARTVTAMHEIDEELAYLRAVLERSS